MSRTRNGFFGTHPRIFAGIVNGALYGISAVLLVPAFHSAYSVTNIAMSLVFASLFLFSTFWFIVRRIDRFSDVNYLSAFGVTLLVTFIPFLQFFWD